MQAKKLTGGSTAQGSLDSGLGQFFLALGPRENIEQGHEMSAVIRGKILKFLTNDEGLVTVEWVAIAAAVVVGGIAISWTVLDSLDPVAGTVGGTLAGVAGTAPTQPDFADGQ